MIGIPLARIIEYPATRIRLSPNWNARPATVDAISMLIIHATADDGNEAGAEAWLCNPESRVSAHLHVRRDGTTTRLVADRRRAWHAGSSRWQLQPSGGLVTDLNRISIGIEVANRNDGEESYTDAQYTTLADLVAHYLRQGIDAGNVVGHEQVAPRRKSDPGPLFDWIRLRLDALRLLFPDEPQPPTTPAIRIPPLILEPVEDPGAPDD